LTENEDECGIWLDLLFYTQIIRYFKLLQLLTLYQCYDHAAAAAAAVVVVMVRSTTGVDGKK